MSAKTFRDYIYVKTIDFRRLKSTSNKYDYTFALTYLREVWEEEYVC